MYYIVGKSEIPFRVIQGWFMLFLIGFGQNKYDLFILYNFEIPPKGDDKNSPIKKPERKSVTKGKWLKITRKGLLVSAISRVGT